VQCVLRQRVEQGGGRRRLDPDRHSRERRVAFFFFRACEGRADVAGKTGARGDGYELFEQGRIATANAGRGGDGAKGRAEIQRPLLVGST